MGQQVSTPRQRGFEKSWRLPQNRASMPNMNMRLIGKASLVLLVLAASSSFGWGRDGHKISGAIAAHYLTPKARAAVQSLLEEQSLADVSTWADEIRSDSSYRWANTLHYANIKPGESAFDLDRDCPKKGCVVSAITKYANVLRDKDSTRKKSVEALKFLVHFVGDVHQPLHASRARDKGGNDIKVEFFQNKTNLHRVWDSGLIRQTKKSWSEYATELQQAITPEQLAVWKSTDPALWATESWKLALSHAYEIPKDGQVGRSYFDRCIPVVDERLSMAGVRMATLLNSIFKEGVVGGALDEAAKPKEPSAVQAFVGSRKSKVYHHPDCSVVKQIKPHNLAEYDHAPENKRLHKGCPW